MRDLRIMLTQARYATLGMLRTPRAMVFGMVLPVVLLVLFGEIFAKGSNTFTRVDGMKIKTVAYYTAGITAYAIMMQTFASLAITVVSQRETGQLKRLRGTPMRSWTFIAAYVLRSIVSVTVALVVLYAVGVLAFGVHLHAAGIVGLIVYAASASAVGPFAAVILSFISGVFIPLKSLPSWLQTVGKIFPLEHLAAGLQRGLVVGATGTGLKASDVGVLVAWAVAGLVIAAVGFRWEPQAAAA
jgi:ABC-2 type transport system permease protein